MTKEVNYPRCTLQHVMQICIKDVPGGHGYRQGARYKTIAHLAGKTSLKSTLELSDREVETLLSDLTTNRTEIYFGTPPIPSRYAKHIVPKLFKEYIAMLRSADGGAGYRHYLEAEEKNGKGNNNVQQI